MKWANEQWNLEVILTLMVKPTKVKCSAIHTRILWQASDKRDVQWGEESYSKYQKHCTTFLLQISRKNIYIREVTCHTETIEKDTYVLVFLFFDKIVTCKLFREVQNFNPSYHPTPTQPQPCSTLQSFPITYPLLFLTFHRSNKLLIKLRCDHGERMEIKPSYAVQTQYIPFLSHIMDLRNKEVNQIKGQDKSLRG